MLIAHPPTEHLDLPLSPITVASVGVLLLVVVGMLLPGPGSQQEQELSDDAPTRDGRVDAGHPSAVESWAGDLSPPQVAARVVALAVFAFAIAAGRIGSPFELQNIAPALVIGVAWPLLILGSALLGPVWRWTDPWDGLGRLLQADASPRGREQGSPFVQETVWPAVVPALAWGWYLSAYAEPLDPRSVGAALAAYSILMVAGCLAFGRQRWLSRTEVFGLLFSWTALLRRGRLVSWLPAGGTEAVLGAVAGGLLFGALRRTTLWGNLNFVPLASLYAAAGVAVCSLLGAALLWGLSRASRRQGALGSVAAASVPAVASIAVAIAMSRYRLFTSFQLLPILASDPFGFGWDLFGTADWGLNPRPIGHLGLALTQVAVLAAGHFLGAFILARRADSDARRPGLVALAVLFGSGMLATTGST